MIQLLRMKNLLYLIVNQIFYQMLQLGIIFQMIKKNQKEVEVINYKILKLNNMLTEYFLKMQIILNKIIILIKLNFLLNLILHLKKQQDINNQHNVNLLIHSIMNVYFIMQKY